MYSTYKIRSILFRTVCEELDPQFSVGIITTNGLQGTVSIWNNKQHINNNNNVIDRSIKRLVW